MYWTPAVTDGREATHPASQLSAVSVTGRVSAEHLGISLMHEHMIFDFSPCKEKPRTPEDHGMVDRKVEMEILGYLRFHPLVVLDNLVNRDTDLVADELVPVLSAGGATIVDPTNRSIGRDPIALKTIALATGMNVIMGAGFYTDCALDDDFIERSIDSIASEITRDIREGVATTGIRAGLIGEVGTSAPITRAEELSLRGAARAQATTDAPLMVHLDGWGREGHRVLDICTEEGASLERVILCHMNPSWEDLRYQTSLADRGAYIEYDMIGNNHVYPRPMGPSPDETASLSAVGKLLRLGYGTKILFSQDVYLKMMFTRFGGLGYGHILRNLSRHFELSGITPDDLSQILVANPQRVLAFSSSE
jgi:phosphotriesterase-related protein